MIYKFFELPRFVRMFVQFFIGLVLYFVLYGFFVRVTVLVRIVLSFSLVFGFHTLFFSKHLVINSYNKYAILPQHSMILSCDSFE
jgi:hypothetical protein